MAINTAQGVDVSAAVAKAPDLPASNTLLRVKSNEVLAHEAEQRAASDQLQQEPVMSALAGFIETRFREAELAKLIETDNMLDALRRRKGTYHPARILEIKQQGGSEIFVKITEELCLNAESWIGDVAIPADGRPWDVQPTPKADLPREVLEQIVQDTLAAFAGMEIETTDDEVRQHVREARSAITQEVQELAKKRADAMGQKIDDQLVEADFESELDEVISDIVTIGTGIVKGPFFTIEKQLAWVEAQGFSPSVTEDPLMKVRRVDPFYLFPSAGSTDPQSATYLCEIDEFTRTRLMAMQGISGWNSEAIATLLRESPRGVTLNLRTDAERALLENRQGTDVSNPDDKFRGIWYVGQLQGRLLLEWGLTGLDADKIYEALALKIGRHVLHASLNLDPLGRRIYSKTVYKPVKGSFWGQGIPKLMEDLQDVCNATARHLVNNLAIASGPQVVINELENLAEGQNPTSIYPWRIWQFSRPAGMQGRPMDFFQPSINVEALLAVFDRFVSMAHDRTGIPKYSGSDTTGAMNTATGLSIVMNQASRVLKKSISYLDRFLIKPLIERVFCWNMLNIDDPGIKGDCKIVASGAMNLFVKEQQQLRVNELLRTTANPQDRMIIGEKGRAALLRAAAKGINIPVDDVVPTNDELERRADDAAKAAQEQANPAPAPLPASSAEMSVPPAMVAGGQMVTQ